MPRSPWFHDAKWKSVDYLDFLFHLRYLLYMDPSTEATAEDESEVRWCILAHQQPAPALLPEQPRGTPSSRIDVCCSMDSTMYAVRDLTTAPWFDPAM